MLCPVPILATKSSGTHYLPERERRSRGRWTDGMEDIGSVSPPMAQKKSGVVYCLALRATNFEGHYLYLSVAA